MDQCSILYMRAEGRDDQRATGLRALGFRVDESADLPPNEVFAAYHA